MENVEECLLTTLRGELSLIERLRYELKSIMISNRGKRSVIVEDSTLKVKNIPVKNFNSLNSCIEKIGSDRFENLILINTGLNNLDNLEDLANLRLLDLSRNKIKVFNGYSLKNLWRLDLSHNNLLSVEELEFSSNKLEEIDLSGKLTLSLLFPTTSLHCNHLEFFSSYFKKFCDVVQTEF